jgi:hypothetical protein
MITWISTHQTLLTAAAVLVIAVGTGTLLAARRSRHGRHHGHGHGQPDLCCPPGAGPATGQDAPETATPGGRSR